QAAAFILFPGLFLSTFSAMKALYTALIGGTFSASQNVGELILVISMLLITAIMGRFFCGFLCSFGSMGDLFWFLGSKLKLPRPKLSPKADRLLKGLKYVVLGGIVLLIWTFGLTILGGTANPWTIFGMYASLSGWSDLSALISVGALLLLIIIVGSMLIERFFCRYLCPLGAVFSLVSRFRLFKIRKPAQNCGGCQACTKRCSMGIPLYGMNVVSDSECIDCMNCVAVCPRDNVKANPKPALAAAVAVVAMSGMYFAGNLASSAAAAGTVSFSAQTDAAETGTSGQYIDGVYTGNGAGYHGTTQVQVTVSNGYITDITVLSTGDDAEFFSKAESNVISRILSSQSVTVDTVSGATFSSNGIMNAVTDALSGALDPASTDTAAASTQQTSTDSTAESEETTSAAVTSGTLALEDGTYTGSGTGFRGETSVSVTVKDGVITAIKVTDYRDDEQYFSRAETTLISEILASQSVDVDVVSGATYSSNGILEAVANALGLDYTATTPAEGDHGGHDRH
ncbi:MAG TPA: FMN-binding protein, partial [Feifaniaceae bacterium]|nr:FMN-binding protein [Feifaniaceae bacterium]